MASWEYPPVFLFKGFNARTEASSIGYLVYLYHRGYAYIPKYFPIIRYTPTIWHYKSLDLFNKKLRRGKNRQ